LGLDEESLTNREKLADERIKIKETVDKDTLSKQERAQQEVIYQDCLNRSCNEKVLESNYDDHNPKSNIV